MQKTNYQDIFHICTYKSWVKQKDSSVYKHQSLSLEGFIHCCEKHQIKGVLERYFIGIENLIILTIDSSSIIPEMKYETAVNGDVFPHIFGPINKDAIIGTKKIR